MGAICRQRTYFFSCTGQIVTSVSMFRYQYEAVTPGEPRAVTEDELMDVGRCDLVTRPGFFMVIFEKGEAKKWKLVDREIREILNRHCVEPWAASLLVFAISRGCHTWVEASINLKLHNRIEKHNSRSTIDVQNFLEIFQRPITRILSISVLK